MSSFDRLDQLFQRITTSYPAWEVVAELLIIGAVVLVIVKFVRGTRAAGALKGLLLLLVMATLLVRILGQRESFLRLTFLYDRALTLVAILLIVVFQPELRRGLIQLGETPLFRRGSAGVRTVVDEIVGACAYLSKSKFGAIIVIGREVGLRGLVEGGTTLSARVSARLLQTIFFPGSALHDLAVVIQGSTLEAAGVQLPLAEPADMPDPTLGSRHRAAVGITKESDALVIVVSEETGTISLAERGRLERMSGPEELRDQLLVRLSNAPLTPGAGASAPNEVASSSSASAASSTTSSQP